MQKKLILLMLLLVASCSIPTKYERDPSSPGYGRDDVKKSRCACHKFYEHGEYL